MSNQSPWHLLALVRHLAVRVEARGASGRDEVHTATGSIRVKENAADPSAVTWHEEGEWATGPLTGLRFHNTTCWRTMPDGVGLELSHLRRGAGSPTQLVQLYPDTAGRWIATGPHQCGQDRYHACIEWGETSLRLQWDVESPSDPYRMIIEASASRPVTAPDR